MIKYVLLLMLLITTNYCNGLTVLSRTDTLIPTPDTTLRKLVIAAEQSKSLKVQVALYEEREALLQKLISTQDEKFGFMKDFYSGQLANLQEQNNLFKEQVNGYERLIKKEKRKRFFSTAFGVIATGIVGFLYLSK